MALLAFIWLQEQAVPDPSNYDHNLDLVLMFVAGALLVALFVVAKRLFSRNTSDKPDNSRIFK